MPLGAFLSALGGVLERPWGRFGSAPGGVLKRSWRLVVEDNMTSSSAASADLPCRDLDFDDADLLPKYLDLIRTWTGLEEVANSMIVHRALFLLPDEPDKKKGYNNDFLRCDGPARVCIYHFSSIVTNKCMTVFKEKFGEDPEHEFRFTFRHWFHRMAVMELVPLSELKRPPRNDMEKKHPSCFAVGVAQPMEQTLGDYSDIVAARNLMKKYDHFHMYK
ncbi:hypothetical protein R1sor_010081 [Riccia sorocarpa]|uniref:Uncharacterized protein n=1 Tax=Riccia sorocarpa TaxID=122646 RepID=A0ABD3I0X9_9MARC